MKEIILLRHGLAFSTGEEGGISDEERMLTAKGKKITLRMSVLLSSMNYHPDIILSSPLIRARETAEIVADTLKCDGKIKIMKFLSPGFPLEQGIRELKKIAAPLSLLVGHMPDLSYLGTCLITGQTSINGLNIKKSGACSISFKTSIKEGTGQLNWLFQPKNSKNFKT